jgi:hypothetical protein
MLGSGPVHANGTRVLAKPGSRTKAEVGTGQTLGSLRGLEAPDFTGGGAPCVAPDVDADLFHPSSYDTPERSEQVAHTIATYCRPCPMRAACYAWGRKVGRNTGIWGGVWLDEPPARRRGWAS